MNNGKSIGMLLFFGGIVLLIGYGIFLGFEELMNALDLISGFFIGLIFVGLITLIVSIYFEQKKDTKETMKDIKKEDLEP
jgi:lipopolysaccharide export LptBFGC system permease protein LptF